MEAEAHANTIHPNQSENLELTEALHRMALMRVVWTILQAGPTARTPGTGVRDPASQAVTLVSAATYKADSHYGGTTGAPPSASSASLVFCAKCYVVRDICAIMCHLLGIFRLNHDGVKVRGRHGFQEDWSKQLSAAPMLEPKWHRILAHIQDV